LLVHVLALHCVEARTGSIFAEVLSALGFALLFSPEARRRDQSVLPIFISRNRAAARRRQRSCFPDFLAGRCGSAPPPPAQGFGSVAAALGLALPSALAGAPPRAKFWCRRRPCLRPATAPPLSGGSSFFAVFLQPR
jgi:hypothetical protein